MQAVAVPTPSRQVAEGQGPVLGIPLVSSQGFKAGQVGLSWLGSCAQCSSLSTGQQDTARSSVCSDALLGPHSPSSGPCVRESGLGKGKRFQLLFQRPQWSSTNCCVSPKSCGTCPGLLPWIMKGYQSAFHHLSSPPFLSLRAPE